MALNYGIEPLWFRFQKQPNAPFGHALGAGFGDILNPDLAYSNSLAGGDPATPVLTANKGEEVRLHVAVPQSTSRGSTFQVHGHSWQRDPYVCPGELRNSLDGACNMTTMTPFGVMTSVGSKAIGTNPFGFAQGAQESLTPYAHFTFRYPVAGGNFSSSLSCSSGAPCDFLFRDQAGFGNVAGLWGILRLK